MQGDFQRHPGGGVLLGSGWMRYAGRKKGRGGQGGVGWGGWVKKRLS